MVLNAATGAVIRNIPLPDGYPAGRGLSGVKLVHDARQRIVAAYAGDANGNLWRFNLRGLPSAWHVAYDRPLFRTANGRPIYGAPTWQAHPSGGYVVVFATGMVLEDADLADTVHRERIHGIWDPTGRDGTPAPGFSTVKEDDLLVQTIVRSEAVVGGHEYFSLSKNQIDWKKHRGWTLALGHTLAGERALDPIHNLGSSVIINTTVIGSADGNAPESCAMAGLPPNYLYVLNALDGAGKPAFDTDGDGKLNDVAMVFVSDGGFSRGIGLQLLQSPDSQSTPAPTSNPSTGNPLVPSGQPGCVAASANVHGTALNPFTVGVQCPPNTRPWSRQQYQLTRVPQ